MRPLNHPLIQLLAGAVALALFPSAILAQPTSQPAATSQPSSASQPAPASQPAGEPLPALVPAYGPYAGMDHSGTPVLPPRQITLPPQSAKPGEERPLPGYDGRPPDGLSAGEALIWVPRAIFYPVHLILKYGVQYPITGAITLAEEHHVLNRVQRFFTFRDGKGGLFPTFFVDFGLYPSMGLYFYLDDLFVPNNNLVLQAGFWPTGWYHFTVTDRFKVFRNDQGTVTLRGEFVWRPDFVFTGLGPDSTSNEYWFGARHTEVEASLRTALKDLNRVTFGLFYRNVMIEGGDSPSVDDKAAPFSRNLQKSMPGYGWTYNLLTAQLKFELDSRSPDRVFTPGSGLRLELFGSLNVDPSDAELSFARYGAEAAGFLDVSGLNHVIALRLYTELLEPIGDAPVPVTERISLGGAEYMRGFLGGWLRGDSALVLTLDYRYPIWTFLDANIFASLGNVFNGRFEDIHIERMMMVWGIGLRSNTSRDVSFDIMLAFGTNQLGIWDDDFRINHVRAVFGINQGF